jgi:hypothetical protein
MATMQALMTMMADAAMGREAGELNEPALAI